MTMHSQHLHFYFFPFMTPGHMIPLVDMARQFARHDPNLKATIVLPHLDAPKFRATIESDRQQGLDISIRQVTLPIAQVGLPDDFVSLTSISSPHMYMQFEEAIQLLRYPVEQFLREDRPDCMVSDFFISWTADLAADLRIPRIIFHVAGFFPLCVYHSFVKHGLYKNFESGSDTSEVVVPGLPDAVRMKKRQLPDMLRDYNPQNPPNGIMEITKEAEAPCYGVVFNSFKELETAYVSHYRASIRSKAWHVGPVSLCVNGEKMDKNGKSDYCLDWLSTKEPESVVYVGFGTLSLFSAAQLREIAVGLEMCGWNFIWAAKTNGRNGTSNELEEWLPEGFEKRVQGKGLVIKSWAPQVSILEHESVGGFLTHCGWNSFLEGLVGGKPMITWPISYEQFESEKLVTEILKIGVSVGNEEWSGRLNVHERALVKGENIAKAVNKVMVGKESVEMRNRVKVLSDEAKKAVEEGGSSYDDLDSLMEEVRLLKNGKVVV